MDIEKLRQKVAADLAVKCDGGRVEMTLRGEEPTTGIVFVETEFVVELAGKLERCVYKLPVHYPFTGETPGWIAQGLWDSVNLTRRKTSKRRTPRR